MRREAPRINVSAVCKNESRESVNQQNDETEAGAATGKGRVNEKKLTVEADCFVCGAGDWLFLVGTDSDGAQSTAIRRRT